MGISRTVGLRRFFRARQEAFWHIGPERLVVGVMEARVDEPLLLACADLFTRAGTALGARVAPGLLDVARAVDALELDHIAALDACYFEIVDDGPRAPADELAGDAVETRVAGIDDEVSVRVDRSVVDSVVALFACAKLNLVALDCAHTAAFNLVSFASGAAPPGDAFAEAVAADALAAVSVAANCEAAASVLGDRLAVPVGLALGRYGFADGG
jgi:hypothetical protein